MRDLAFEISEYISSVKFEDIPEGTIQNVKLFIFDTMGVGIAGHRAPGVRPLYELLSQLGGSRDSTVLKFRTRLPAPSATLLNSTMIHAYDFDDTFDEGALHTYVSVLPSVLSLAEWSGNTGGKEILTAITLGVDLIVRLSLGIKTPLSWIRTATLGSFGAAAASAKILGFGKDKTHRALGVVYSMTSGNAQTLIDGGLTKRMQPGFSARAGVFAAMLADKGINGAIDVFEGKYGYFNLYEREEYEREPITRNLGKEFYSDRLSIKPYPSCRMTHSSIDATLELITREDIQPGEVEKIEVFVSRMAKNMVGKFKLEGNPQVEAQFSIPYTVATAVMKREVFIDDFEEENVLGNKERLEFLKKVFVFEDESFNEKDISSARVKIYTKRGIFEHSVKGLKGSPSKPMSEEEVKEKFKKCLEFASEPAELANRVQEIVMDLENRDLKELLEVLS